MILVPAIIMNKQEARKEYRQKRKDITESQRMKWDDLILIQFQSIDLPFMNYVLSFYPIEANKEINSFILTDYLHFKNPNLHVCYPRMTNNQGHMQAIDCNADSIFEENEYGILEPLDTEVISPALIDIVIIPLLAFDERGYRVGYGKGYYDRFLADCRDDCIKVGVSYFEAIDAIKDTNDNDVPLDFCITPQKVYAF